MENQITANLYYALLQIVFLTRSKKLADKENLKEIAYVRKTLLRNQYPDKTIDRITTNITKPEMTGENTRTRHYRTLRELNIESAQF